MTTGIYRITDKAGRTYIGSSLNIEHRWQCHRTDLNREVHTNSKLQWAWRRKGGDDFTFEIVEVTSVDELQAAEQRWLDATGAAITGYNVNPTSDGSLRSAETRKKLSDAKQGEGHHLHKLTAEQVSEIKRRLLDGERRTTLASDFNISPQTISDIKAGRGWKSVPWPTTGHLVNEQRGEHHYATRLTEQDVATIKQRLCNGESTKSIAPEYAITHATLSDIKYGRTWKHVPWPEPYEPRKDDWLPITTVQEVKRRIVAGDRIADISRTTGINPNVIAGIKRGDRYTDI
jgi:group I intron endonuclease